MKALEKIEIMSLGGMSKSSGSTVGAQENGNRCFFIHFME